MAKPVCFAYDIDLPKSDTVTLAPPDILWTWASSTGTEFCHAIIKLTKPQARFLAISSRDLRSECK